jgi:hypothetical protein
VPFQPSPSSRFLASVVAAAGVVLTVAGCSHVAPLGPEPPQPRRLGSPIILQAMRSQPRAPAGRCPAGWVALAVPGSTGTCYRKVGTPLTITSAAVSSLVSGPRVSPAGQQPGRGPASYGFAVAMPTADVGAVTAIIRQAYNAQGAVDISVAGKTWAAPQVIKPFPGQQLQIFLPSKSQALQLRHLLVRHS